MIIKGITLNRFRNSLTTSATNTADRATTRSRSANNQLIPWARATNFISVHAANGSDKTDGGRQTLLLNTTAIVVLCSCHLYTFRRIH